MTTSLLQRILEAIPSHREPGKTRDQLLRAISQKAGLPPGEINSALGVGLELLRLLDLIQDSNDYIVLSGQIQTYCRNSLLWYLENNREVLSNWNRPGAAQEDVSVANLLDQAPYFLKALEEKRRAISEQNGLPMTPSREQSCSVVLFKITHEGVPYYLHQWDREAEQYQLIGGKQRANETPLQTAQREVVEEVSGTKMVAGRTLFLTACPIDPIDEWEVSRTYGALTRYRFDMFHARVTAKPFVTSAIDLWISAPEAIRGRTHRGDVIAPLIRTISERDPGFLETLAGSIEVIGTLRLSVP